jgi:SAM-dependent methyltransferase
MEILPFFNNPFQNFQSRSTDKATRNDLFNLTLFRKDVVFDDLYPEHIQNLSQMHWTPVEIARKAADFLAIPNARVLDIGSGVGKFCMVAGFFHPAATFYGIEQREELYTFAEIAKAEIDVPNVRFIHGNLTDLDFSGFDHFYFYNPFYENIEPDSRIDYAVETSFELYDQYSRLVYQMLAEKPSETRLVTFHAPDSQVPPGYQLVNNSYSRVLKMWIKE